MTSTVKKEITLPIMGVRIPIGTKLDVYFDKANPYNVYFEDVVTDYPHRIPLLLASKYLTGFSNPPSMKTLERWSNDGVAKTPTGKRVEPDGFGPDGSPSWLLVNGLI